MLPAIMLDIDVHRNMNDISEVSQKKFKCGLLESARNFKRILSFEL